VSLEKAQALVIRQVDFSESSRVVTFLTREFGRVSALAKGAKRLKGPFEAALDLLSECRVVFIRKAPGVLNLLTEARLLKRFQPPQTDPGAGLSRLYGGYYIAELLNGLTEDFDPDPAVYDLTTASLSRLTSPDSSPSSTLIHFEISLLRLIGLLPNLFECTVCGTPVEPDSQLAHWVSQGGLLCPECRREEYAGTSISAGSAVALRSLAADDADSATSVTLTKHQEQECHKLAVSAITQALGRRPGTLRYIQI
jgi:DNA repair protein RecO (recombination protein O)